MKRTILLMLVLLAFASVACAADVAPVAERYARSYGFADFKLNQDSMKYEVPENAAYRIMPRLKRTEIWTGFAVPQESQEYLEWVVTAVVRASDGPAPGVGIWSESDGHVLCIFPDGTGALRQYEGKKSVWSKEIKIENFSYPANLTLWRDANGSIIAKVDGIVVAAKLLDVDIQKPQTPKVTSICFATRSATAKAEGSAYYEKLDIEGWGKRNLSHLFKE